MEEAEILERKIFMVGVTVVMMVVMMTTTLVTLMKEMKEMKVDYLECALFCKRLQMDNFVYFCSFAKLRKVLILLFSGSFLTRSL